MRGAANNLALAKPAAKPAAQPGTTAIVQRAGRGSFAFKRDKKGVKYWGRNYWARQDVQPTHLLLNGGVLCVPDGENARFCEDLAADIDAGIPNYVVEKRSPIFKMFVDLDILEEDELSTDTLIETWVKNAQYVIREFYGRSFQDEGDLSVLVCRAPHTHVEKNKRKWVKSGVHLIWPSIFATVKEAQMLRLAFIQHFERVVGERDTANPYEDVFDKQVYKTNGLRMIGSDKLDDCPSCNGKTPPNNFCETNQCDGVLGKYDANRPYRVVDAITGDGERDTQLIRQCRASTVTEVSAASIRSTAPLPSPFERPEWFDDTYFTDEVDEHKSNFGQSRHQEAFRQWDEDEMGAKELGVSNVPKLPRNDERVKCIEAWIRDAKLPEAYRVPEVYRKTSVIKVAMIPGDRHPFYIVWTNSTFCMNKAGKHNHNTIYFLINEYGLYQKCWCRCESTAERKFGMCRDYCSSVKSMPLGVLRNLYPDLFSSYSFAHSVSDAISHTEDPNDLPDEVETVLLDTKLHEITAREEKLKARQRELVEKQFRSKRK